MINNQFIQHNIIHIQIFQNMSWSENKTILIGIKAPGIWVPNSDHLN